jgi:hypothetical protein
MSIMIRTTGITMIKDGTITTIGGSAAPRRC